MAVDIFLHFLPPLIKGETKDKVFGPLNGIDILSFSWGMSQSANTSYGGGLGAGKASFSDITFSKYLDNATTMLQTALARGTHLTKAILTVRKAGDGAVNYQTITLEQVIVTSYQSAASGGDDRLMETFSLAYAKVTSHYFLQGDKGAVTQGPEFIWNLQTNNAA
jgi:type VI secretion system secreted protein Hcp